jgi:hypothetical protein
VNLERQLGVDLDQSTRAMDRGLVANCSTPSQHVARREQAVILADALGSLPEVRLPQPFFLAVECQGQLLGIGWVNQRAGVDEKVLTGILARFIKVKPAWHDFIDLSVLPEALKEQFHILLESRFARLE